MTIESINASFYADPTALGALKRDAAAQSPDSLRETAKQFESLFTTMLLKSMRAASPGDPYASDQQDFYQDMFDQQLAAQLAGGKGLGLADVLMRQLMQGADGGADAWALGLGGVPGVSAGMGSASASGGTPAANWPPRDA